MRTYPVVTLAPGREKSVKNHHHWIFSGAVAGSPVFKNGDILAIHSSSNEFLGYAFCNNGTSIFGRMITWDDTYPEKAIKNRIIAAAELREKMFDPKYTNAYRLIHGEWDSIPGLTIDCYNDCLVLQVATTGIERMKDEIIKILVEKFSPKCIYEKSNLPGRKEENLPMFEWVLYGELPESVEIMENGMKFKIYLHDSQKTGFFLDQREMRAYIGGISAGKKVLNTFSYNGGFSIAAALGGATSTTSVDISKSAIEESKENFLLNWIDLKNHTFITADAFEFLRNEWLKYDLVILDPPAFAKKKADIQNAIRGYREINTTTMKKMPSGSFLLTCSCSYHVDEETFMHMLFDSARDAKREVRVLARHRQATDHCMNIFHGESSDYLKSFLLYIV